MKVFETTVAGFANTPLGNKLLTKFNNAMYETREHPDCGHIPHKGRGYWVSWTPRVLCGKCFLELHRIYGDGPPDRVCDSCYKIDELITPWTIVIESKRGTLMLAFGLCNNCHPQEDIL